MTITEVSLFAVHGVRENTDRPAGDRQAQMMDIYPDANASDWARARPSGRTPTRAVYVEIHTDDGVSGVFGPIEDEQAYVIRRFIAPIVIGRDPFAIEQLSDRMLRAHRHGRSGMFMTGLSVVDCALWDLKGKALDVPVYRMLGGPVRDAIPAYASMLGFSVDPARAAVTARATKELGYTAQKWFFRYGPGDGPAGLDKNRALVAALREALGPGYPLMLDAFMAWDVPYASAMVRAIEPYDVTWLEEPLPPERIGEFRRLKEYSRVPLATGEHVYTRWQVKELLVAGAVEYIQCDPDWCGGISELVKICALSSSFGVPVVAHGHSLLPALHVAAAQSPTVVPYVEYLIRHQDDKQHFHSPAYRPANGVVRLPDLPGLGLALDSTKIERREPWTPAE